MKEELVITVNVKLVLKELMENVMSALKTAIMTLWLKVVNANIGIL